MFLKQSDKVFANLTYFMAFLAQFFGQKILLKKIMTAQKKCSVIPILYVPTVALFVYIVYIDYMPGCLALK